MVYAALTAGWDDALNDDEMAYRAPFAAKIRVYTMRFLAAIP